MGAVVLVTGATDGMGRYLVDRLTADGDTVVAHGRDAGKLRQLRDETGADTVQADLAQLRQVEAMADELHQRLGRLDVLVNNAGVGLGTPGASRELSHDGFELRCAVNYLAGYLLTRRLLPLLVESAPARIVNVASAGQEPIDFDDLMLERSYDGVTAYRRSKLAQIMFTVDLAAELRDRGVTVNALHPATFMDTTMVREHGVRPVSSVEEGATATLRLITDSELDAVTGQYFDGERPARAHRSAYDDQARARLREVSEQLVEEAVAAR